MPAAQIAILVAQYGIPFVEYLIQLIQNKTDVTAVEWANLKTLASVTGKSELMARLQANGVDPTSPQGLALIALVEGPSTFIDLPVPPPAPSSTVHPTAEPPPQPS